LKEVLSACELYSHAFVTHGEHILTTSVAVHKLQNIIKFFKLVQMVVLEWTRVFRVN